MSLLAEEIANGTLKLILSKLSVLPLNLFHFPRWIILFTHDLTRSPLHSTWVTHVKRRRTARGMFVLNLRTGSFYCGYKYPFIAVLTPLLRSISPPLSSFRTLAPPLLHRRRRGRASLPQPRRRRTCADRGNLHLRRRRSLLPPPS